MLNRIYRWFPSLAAAFWFVFFLAYPYRELIDDSRFKGILENRFFFFESKLMRPLQHGLLYLQGWLFEPSMVKAVVVTIGFHLLIGWVTWKHVIPRMPERARMPAFLGLLAFIAHPASLQTVVHVAQRAEVLATLFCAISIAVWHAFQDRRPTGRALALLWACALGAVTTKENYALVPFLVAVALGSKHRLRAAYGAAALMIPAILLFVLGNSFTTGVIQNEDNYRRSRAFRQALLEEREISNADSIMLPLRDRLENLQLQTALVPLVVKDIALPFAMVSDEGHFPYGKKSYSKDLAWLWVGAAALAFGLFLIARNRRRFTPGEWALLLSPAMVYGTYWVIPVYDPLMVYRLYGVVFLLFVVSLPLALRDSPNALTILGVLAALAGAGGLVRAYEMADPVREARLELKRQPHNYRMYIRRAHAEVGGRKGPVDCRALLEAALKLAPSTALVNIEAAWCYQAQGRMDEARHYARKSLEQEQVPENVQVALNYLMSGGGVNFEPGAVHPTNLKAMVTQSSEPPAGD